MSDAASALSGIQMNEPRFLKLLEGLIGVVETLQNNPSQGLVPREDNASDLVLEALKPYTKEQGGPLLVERVYYTEQGKGRGNVIIQYPGTGDKTLTFLGSHLDVVPANPETWTVDPFHLKIDGDNLYGRGTTDCLGHVALLTDLFCALGERRPALSRTVVAVFIASEENHEIEGVGIDGLQSSGKLEELGLKRGPIFWVDSADSQPCIGTAGNMQWSLKANGKLFHSGLPHQAINPIELLMEGLSEIQRRFYKDFPEHPDEKKYNYKTSCTMKPTQIECARGSLNQIPPHATASGDCRITPFYTVKDVQAKIEGYVKDINENIGSLPSHGPWSKYELPDRRGSLELSWVFDGEDGIACKLDSEGNAALASATEQVLGAVTPYSISGSLPLVRWMQDNGYDVQLCGYGLSSRYHAEDECCSLSKMKEATRILSNVVRILEGVTVES